MSSAMKKMTPIEAPAVDPSAVETHRMIAVAAADPDVRHFVIAGAAVVAALVVGFIVGRSTASPEAPAIKVVSDVVAPEPAQAPIPHAALVVEADPQATEPGPEPEPEPASEPELDAEPQIAAPTLAAATALPTGCTISVRSTPPRALVLAGDAVLGRTPLEASVPCGKADLTIRRHRYLDETRRVVVQPGAPQRVDARLERPEYNLRVTSTPHALVYVDGVALGFSPVVAKVKAFTPVELTFERSGYQTGSTTAEATEPASSVDVRLIPDS